MTNHRNGEVRMTNVEERSIPNKPNLA